MDRKILAVHDGTFHADEVFCLAVLLDLPEFKDCAVVRTRDPGVISSAYAAVDVGGEYEHARRRYDHHQRGYNEVFDANSRVKMAAAGLVWRHFGEEYLAQRYPGCGQRALLHTLLYHRFVKPIDGNDNGIDPCVAVGEGARLEILYSDCVTIASKVGSFNPQWNDEDRNDPEKARTCFERALAYMRDEFRGYADAFVAHRLPVYEEAMRLVGANIEAAERTGRARRIITLDRYIPLKDAIPEVERMLGVSPERGACFVVTPREGGDWAALTVPLARGSKAFRVGIRAEWRGLRDCEREGIPIRFVHITGFMGISATREGAERMASLSLEGAERWWE